MDEMLQAYKAEWDDSVDVASDEDMHSPAPCTPERVPRINDVKVLDSPELNQRISEWQTLDLRSPSPRPSTAAQSSWEVPSDQVSTERVAEDKVETALPWTPVAVSPRTERLFMEQSMGDPCANSPIRGNESPRHLLFKKWYRQETWVDPELVRDSDLEVISNDSVLSEDAGSLSPAGSADATVHLIGKSAEYVAEVCRQVRFVCAWKQMQMSLETELPDGIVEWDSTRTAVKRKKDKRVLKASAKARMKRPAAVRKKPASSVAVHSGRLLLGTHRGSDKKLVLPLPPKSTSSKAPGPPETVEEVYPWIASKTNAKRHVVGSDSSKGLQGACQRLNLPQAQARHSLSEYTPVQTLLLKNIAKRALKKMRGSYQTKGKKMQMVGGDQKCEALAGQIKASMRRAGKLGRAAADSSGEHLDPLSLYFLSVHPGLDSDLFEANRFVSAMTAHPCKSAKESVCDTSTNANCAAECDGNGADVNTFRDGGPGHALFNNVDVTLPFTVTTRFITNNGMPNGTLIEIEQELYQAGRSYKTALTDQSAAETAKHFRAANKFGEVYGGLKQMGESLHNGMVLVIALWSDPGTLAWGFMLDSCDANKTVYDCAKNHEFNDIVWEEANQVQPGIWRGPVDYYPDFATSFQTKDVAFNWAGIPPSIKRQVQFNCKGCETKTAPCDCASVPYALTVSNIKVKHTAPSEQQPIEPGKTPGQGGGGSNSLMMTILVPMGIALGVAACVAFLCCYVCSEDDVENVRARRRRKRFMKCQDSSESSTD
eukprot:symbB.v1.2.001189.t1/scaffold50.1/size381796/4